MQELSAPAPPWFGTDFVERHRARYGHRPPEERQLTYDIAVDDEYAPWRAWLDEQLALLELAQAAEQAGRVWLDEGFWTVLFEMAVGAHLRASGFHVAYERALDGLTPDWTILTQSGDPAGFVEVHTDNPTSETFGQMRAWHGLVQRIKKIPVSVVLMLAPSDRPLATPDPHTAKKIAQQLRSQMLSPWPSAPAFTSCGYTFHAMGDPRRGGRLMDSPFGRSACFEPPSSRVGVVSADRLLENTQEKVAKYRDLARARRVPLAVAVGAHKFTGVTLDTVDQALQGAPAPFLTLQFGPGDTFFAQPTTFELKPVAPWPMPADLAALMWVDHAFPFAVTLRPNSLATIPFPTESPA
jgi:hypothetical protein